MKDDDQLLKIRVCLKKEEGEWQAKTEEKSKNNVKINQEEKRVNSS